jgi:hypothetical protein
MQPQLRPVCNFPTRSTAEEGERMETEPIHSCPIPAGCPQVVLSSPAGAVCSRGLKCNHFANILYTREYGKLPPRVAFCPSAPQRTVITLAIAVSGVLAEEFAPHCPAPSAEEVHQGGDAALSCRLCLIACNSCQFDEQELEHD